MDATQATTHLFAAPYPRPANRDYYFQDLFEYHTMLKRHINILNDNDFKAANMNFTEYQVMVQAARNDELNALRTAADCYSAMNKYLEFAYSYDPDDARVTYIRNHMKTHSFSMKRRAVSEARAWKARVVAQHIIRLGGIEACTKDIE